MIVDVLFILLFFWFIGWLFGDKEDEPARPTYRPQSTPQRSDSSSLSGLTDYMYEEEIGIKTAMSLAMSDGTLHKSEATAINKYMKEVVKSGKYGYDKDTLKEHLNASLLTAKKLSDRKKLSTNKLCQVAATDFEERYQFEILQLCLNVMAADGKAEREELIQIDRIADKIGIYNGSENRDYISLRDQALITLRPSAVTKGDTLDEKLGIKKSWPKKKKLEYITKLFKKWNGRMSTVKTDRERKNVQNMLNLLAEAYEKYK